MQLSKTDSTMTILTLQQKSHLIRFSHSKIHTSLAIHCIFNISEILSQQVITLCILYFTNSTYEQKKNDRKLECLSDKINLKIPASHFQFEARLAQMISNQNWQLHTVLFLKAIIMSKKFVFLVEWSTGRLETLHPDIVVLFRQLCLQ